MRSSAPGRSWHRTVRVTYRTYLASVIRYMVGFWLQVLFDHLTHAHLRYQIESGLDPWSRTQPRRDTSLRAVESAVWQEVFDRYGVHSAWKNCRVHIYRCSHALDAE